MPAVGAITAEDLALDRSLEALANEMPPEISEGSSFNLIKKEKTSNEMLAEHVENYHPAQTVNELMEQVHLAKQVGADSIEASPEIIRSYTRKSGYPDDVGFFFFQDIKVWIPGFFDTHSRKERETMEQRLFGHSKIKTQPIMQLDDKK